MALPDLDRRFGFGFRGGEPMPATHGGFLNHDARYIIVPPTRRIDQERPIPNLMTPELRGSGVWGGSDRGPVELLQLTRERP
jgi:hypothetical protein